MKVPHIIAMLLAFGLHRALADISIVSSNDSSIANGTNRAHLSVSWRTPNSNLMQNFITAVIRPLTPAAVFNDSNKQPITGSFSFVDSNHGTNDLQADIAYLSCEDPPGNLNASALFSLAAAQKPAAVVLYSTTSDFCNFTTTSTTDDREEQALRVYTMVNRNVSARFETEFSASTSVLATAVIASQVTMPAANASNSTDNGGDSSNPLGPAPTTAVAMIILYSITGVITALFLIIIITGAVRAHRHPERYGPRQGVLGRPRQSRAKGIARAMLETIPIVKFGDAEPEKTRPPASDMELGPSTNAARRQPGSPELPGGEEASDVNADHGGAAAHPAASPAVDGIDGVAAADAPNHPATHADVNGGQASGVPQPQPANEESLGCSICTEDFVKGEDVRVLPCDHKYHPACIDPWLLNVSGTCPLCRIDLRPAGSQGDTTGPEAVSNQGRELNLPLPVAESSGEGETRRGRGISSYLENHLGISAHARPEERIAALRRLRERNRTDGDMETSDRRRSRLSGIFRDPFRRRLSTANASDEADANHEGAPQVADEHPTESATIR